MFNHSAHRDPPYLVAPRYLAGPDETATANVLAGMLANRWQATSFDNACVFRLVHEDELLEAIHIPGSRTPSGGKGPAIGWECTSRPGPGKPRTWAVRFTGNVPPELIAALIDEVTRPHRSPAPDETRHDQLVLPPAQEATRPLEVAGWIRDLAMHECAWYAPGERAVVVTPLLPEERDHAGAHWLFAARRGTGNIALWHGTAHPRTPTHVIRALCEAMTNPVPVPRRTRPWPDDGYLIVTQR